MMLGGVGQYTQLDLPPQPAVYENQPLRWALENPHDAQLYLKCFHPTALTSSPHCHRGTRSQH